MLLNGSASSKSKIMNPWKNHETLPKNWLGFTNQKWFEVEISNNCLCSFEFCKNRSEFNQQMACNSNTAILLHQRASGFELLLLLFGRLI